MYVIPTVLLICIIELFILPKIKCVGRYWQVQAEHKAKLGEEERYNYPDPDRMTNQWLAGSALLYLGLLALGISLSFIH